MIKYKLKGVDYIYSGKFKREVLIVPLVGRWIDGKFDKFIPMNEAINILDGAVINPEDKNSIMSSNDKANYGKQSLF